MPGYVPTEECLDSIFLALDAAGLRRRTGPQLLERLNGFVDEKWPVAGPSGCAELFQHPRSAALAFSLALLWQPEPWNAPEALQKFADLRMELLAAWDAVPYTDIQKLRKIVDHVVVAGVRQNRAPALDVFLSLLKGNPFLYQGPVGECAGFLRGRPAPGAAGAGAPAMDGLIPDLDLCWQEDFRLDVNYHVAEIMNKLLQPFIPLPEFAAGDSIVFAWDGGNDSVVVVSRRLPDPEADPHRHQDSVPTGSRRTYVLASGSAALIRNDAEWARLVEGQRLILRALDRSKAHIQLAELAKGNVRGPKLDFVPGDVVRLEVHKDGTRLEAWSCTCGTWQCDKRHRLAAWDPSSMPAAMTLNSFLWTAVKGATTQIHIKSFIQGMYYALLSNEG